MIEIGNSLVKVKGLMKMSMRERGLVEVYGLVDRGIC